MDLFAGLVKELGTQVATVAVMLWAFVRLIRRVTGERVGENGERKTVTLADLHEAMEALPCKNGRTLPASCPAKTAPTPTPRGGGAGSSAPAWLIEQREE